MLRQSTGALWLTTAAEGWKTVQQIVSAKISIPVSRVSSMRPSSEGSSARVAKSPPASITKIPTASHTLTAVNEVPANVKKG